MPLTLASLGVALALELHAVGRRAPTSRHDVPRHARARSLRHRLRRHVPHRRGADGAAGARASCASTSFEFGEFYALLLFATAGHDDPGAGRPISSPSSSASRRCRSRSTCSPARGATRRRASEGAMKYFMVGAFATSDPALRHGARLRRGRLDRRSPTSRAWRRAWPRRRCSSSASCSSSSRSASRSRPCRFTCGRPTRTKARPRR